MNRPRLVLIIMLAGILGLCGFVYITTMLPQDLRLRQYKEAFSQIQHPANTTFVGAYRLLGALDTQRVMYKETYPQACDYIVGEVREYLGTQADLQAFYAGQTATVEQEAQKLYIWFIPIDSDGHIDPYGWGEYGPNGDRLLQRLKSSPWINLDPARPLYFVFIWDMEAASDFRCLI